MNKKIHTRITILILAIAFTLYSLVPMQALAATTFKRYKVIITTSKLNIRGTASTKGKLVGYYSKNNIVDIIGQSGSWLRTSKGYIASNYTKKYTTSTKAQTTPKTTFKSYKVIITTSKLNIRSTASTSGKIAGSFYKNNIIDVTGLAGSWLKTSKGYISSLYTQRYISTPSRGGQVGLDAGKYIKMNNDEQLLLSPGGIIDERYAVKGKTYQIIDDNNGYYGIKFGSILGYIPSSSATIVGGVPKNKLTLAWNYIYAKSSNKLYYDDSNDYANRNSASIGLDVISPTWFSVSGDAAKPSSIGVTDIADKEYVTTAHKNGYQIWACFKEGNDDRAYKVFYDQSVRDRVITQVLSLAKQYNIDGINIDFEGIGGIAQNKAGFTAFVTEFYTRAKALNLTVSADVIKPSTSQVWSKWYDRAALSNTVDYLMYMAYDEHASGSSQAGSVGSYAWVEDGIKNILAEGVPSSKLVLGVPFYLRDFTVMDVNTKYDSVIPTKSTSLYKQPTDSVQGTASDTQPGLVLKNNGLNQTKYTIDFNGQQGYIDQSYVNAVPANTLINPVNQGNSLRLPYDSVVSKVQTSVYNQSSESSNYKISDIAQGTALKYIGITGDMFSVEYNGQTGYVPQRDTALIAAGNNLLESSGVQGIILPYDSVLVTSLASIDSLQQQTADNKVADVDTGYNLKYKGTSGKWYIADYNGQSVYISTADSILVYANTKKTMVLGSTSLKMQTAYDRIAFYGGTTYYDSDAKQQVGVYYKDGAKHIVWLENAVSMGWRMDFVNKYDLPGIGAWQLYQETPDTWDVIKSKLKN